MKKGCKESIGRIKIKKNEKIKNDLPETKIPEDAFDELLLHIQNSYKNNKDKS